MNLMITERKDVKKAGPNYLAFHSHGKNLGYNTRRNGVNSGTSFLLLPILQGRDQGAALFPVPVPHRHEQPRHSLIS